MSGATEAAQVFEEQDRVAGLEEFAEQVERQVHAQAGRVDIAAAVHKRRLPFFRGCCDGLFDRGHGSRIEHAWVSGAVVSMESIRKGLLFSSILSR